MDSPYIILSNEELHELISRFYHLTYFPREEGGMRWTAGTTDKENREYRCTKGYGSNSSDVW